MAHELKNLTIEEVSLVDRPANPGAKVVLLKRARDADDKVGLLNKLAQALGLEIEGEGDDMPKDVEKTLTDLGETVQKLQARLDLDAAIAKAERLFQAASSDTETALAALEKTHKDDDRVVDLRKRVDAAKASKTREIDEEAFQKALPAVVRKAYEALPEADRAEFRKSYKPTADAATDPVALVTAAVEKALGAENATLKATVARLERDNLVAKTTEEFKDLAPFVDLTEFVPAYLEVAKASADAAKAMLAPVKALAGQAQEHAHLFKAIGRDGAGPNTAVGKIEAAVKKYQAEHAGVTKEQAEAAVLTADPSLYDAYNAEKEAR